MMSVTYKMFVDRDFCYIPIIYGLCTLLFLDRITRSGPKFTIYMT